MGSRPPAQDVAVSVQGVAKHFVLPHEQVHTLKERALHPLKRRTSERLEVLKDVSFEVQRGEFFGIVGRNGSGKSTLLKSLAGIYRPDTGDIWMRGRVAPFIELGVGFNPDLSARDNVMVNAIMLGLTPTQARERYDAIVEFAELEDFVDLKLKNYSSGMQVRLAFSVMVHVDAEVLLIDEVLAVGDAAFQRKCADALNRVHDQGTTVLLVTHDMNAVHRHCQRALLLERGAVVSVGEPGTVARRYEEINFQTGRRAELATPGAPVGGGEAAIVDAWFEDAEGRRTDAVPRGLSLRMCMSVEFRSDAEDPVFGFVLTDERHRMILAADSSAVRPQTGSFSAGDRIDVAVTFTNLLGNGRYFASPQVAHAGTPRLMDHRENAASIVVTGSREGAMVDLPYELELRPVASAAEPAPVAP